jgi:hypothetical protein
MLLKLTLLPLRFDPGVTVGVLNDLVRNLFDVLLHLSVAILAANETLCGEKGVLWVYDSLTLGSNTDQALAILGEANN